VKKLCVIVAKRRQLEIVVLRRLIVDKGDRAIRNWSNRGSVLYFASKDWGNPRIAFHDNRCPGRDLGQALPEYDKRLTLCWVMCLSHLISSYVREVNTQRRKLGGNVGFQFLTTPTLNSDFWVVIQWDSEVTQRLGGKYFLHIKASHTFPFWG
jgi:hypothetical protein